MFNSLGIWPCEAVSFGDKEVLEKMLVNRVKGCSGVQMWGTGGGGTLQGSPVEEGVYGVKQYNGRTRRTYTQIDRSQTTDTQRRVFNNIESVHTQRKTHRHKHTH